MRGVYEANYRLSGVNSARTLGYITVPSTIVVDILSAKITNESNETNEQLSAIWQRVTTLGTPTATSVTPAKKEKGDQAAASTVKMNVTASEPTYGSVAQSAAIVDGHELQGFPSLSGAIQAPTPEERFTIPPSDTYGLRLLIAPSSAIDIDVSILFQEKG